MSDQPPRLVAESTLRQTVDLLARAKHPDVSWLEGQETIQALAASPQHVPPSRRRSKAEPTDE